MAGILRERSVESSTSAAPLECVTARMRGGGGGGGGVVISGGEFECGSD